MTDDMMSRMLTIDPDVARMLGSDDAVRTVRRTAEAGYRCAACGEPGQLTPHESASVVLVLHAGSSIPVVRLAHGCCADSTIVVSPEPLPAEAGQEVPGTAWLRPHPDTPRAVLLLGPRLTGMRITAGGDTIDRALAGLLAGGFGLLTDPDAPMRTVHGLTIRSGPAGRLLVGNSGGGGLWDGTLVPPAGWVETAHTAGRLGVVVAAGLNLNNPHRDHLTDLFTAIGDGAAVAGTGRLLLDSTPT